MALSFFSLASFSLAGAWRGPPRCVVMVLVSVVALCLAAVPEQGRSQGQLSPPWQKCRRRIGRTALLAFQRQRR